MRLNQAQYRSKREQTPSVEEYDAIAGGDFTSYGSMLVILADSAILYECYCRRRRRRGLLKLRCVHLG